MTAGGPARTAASPCGPPAGMTRRVVIADDQDLVRAGLRVILETNGVDVVGEAADGEEAVALAERCGPTSC